MEKLYPSPSKCYESHPFLLFQESCSINCFLSPPYVFSSGPSTPSLFSSESFLSTFEFCLYHLEKERKGGRQGEREKWRGRKRKRKKKGNPTRPLLHLPAWIIFLLRGQLLSSVSLTLISQLTIGWPLPCPSIKSTLVKFFKSM